MVLFLFDIPGEKDRSNKAQVAEHSPSESVKGAVDEAGRRGPRRDYEDEE